MASIPVHRLSRDELTAARDFVRSVLPPTPQYAWPLLAADLGTAVWVKHENHTLLGAFKLRGGLTYLAWLCAQARPRGLVTATRGNHGQSIPFAAQRYGVPVAIVVPHGNSREKNAAMRALGAELIEHGDDYQSAAEFAVAEAERRGWSRVPAFHPELVRGVATAGLEFLEALPQLDVVYVPIGMGSGACAMCAVRDALALRTRIVGVVSAQAPTYALSIAAGAPVAAAVSTELADGLACRQSDPLAVTLLQAGLDHVVQVSDREIARAMGVLFEATHNVAEGAGAAAYAAAWKERERLRGQRVGVMLTGGNVDRSLFAEVLSAPPERWLG